MAGFLFGAAGMFVVTYSTQAILPQLGLTFHVTPSQAGLTISVVVFSLAVVAIFLFLRIRVVFGREVRRIQIDAAH